MSREFRRAVRKSKRPAGSRPSLKRKSRMLFLGRDRVLRGFRDAELHNGLGLDLNGLAGLRVASHAGFTVRFHQAANAGNDEYAALLGFFNRGVGQMLQERRRGLVVNLRLLRQVTYELCFGHARCHESSSFAVSFNGLRSYLNTPACGKIAK